MLKKGKKRRKKKLTLPIIVYFFQYFSFFFSFDSEEISCLLFSSLAVPGFQEKELQELMHCNPCWYWNFTWDQVSWISQHFADMVGNMMCSCWSLYLNDQILFYSCVPPQLVERPSFSWGWPVKGFGCERWGAFHLLGRCYSQQTFLQLFLSSSQTPYCPLLPTLLLQYKVVGLLEDGLIFTYFSHF